MHLSNPPPACQPPTHTAIGLSHPPSNENCSGLLRHRIWSMFQRLVPSHQVAKLLFIRMRRLLEFRHPNRKRQRPVCPVDQDFLSSNNAHDDTQMMEDVDTQSSPLTVVPTNTQNSHPPTAQYNNNGESAGWQPK